MLTPISRPLIYLIALSLLVLGCDAGGVPRVLYSEQLKPQKEWRLLEIPDEDTKHELMRQEAEAGPIMMRNRRLISRQPNVYYMQITLLSVKNGDYANTVGIQAWVKEKVPDEELPLEDRMPATLEGVPVQFVEKLGTAGMAFFPPRAVFSLLWEPGNVPEEYWPEPEGTWRRWHMGITPKRDRN